MSKIIYWSCLMLIKWCLQYLILKCCPAKICWPNIARLPGKSTLMQSVIFELQSRGPEIEGHAPTYSHYSRAWQTAHFSYDITCVINSYKQTFLPQNDISNNWSWKHVTKDDMKIKLTYFELAQTKLNKIRSYLGRVSLIDPAR